MDGALGSELTRQLLPLAAAAHPEDDAVEGLPPVGVVPTGGLARPELLEDGQDALPEGIRHFPDRPQRLAFASLLAFGLRSRCGHDLALPGDTSFLLSCANAMPWNAFSDSFLGGRCEGRKEDVLQRLG